MSWNYKYSTPEKKKEKKKYSSSISGGGIWQPQDSDLQFQRYYSPFRSSSPVQQTRTRVSPRTPNPQPNEPIITPTRIHRQRMNWSPRSAPPKRSQVVNSPNLETDRRIRCVFLPCPENSSSKKKMVAKEITIYPYPGKKKDLEAYFEKSSLYAVDGEKKFRLNLQFFIVNKNKPVVTFRKSQGLQPWKITNKLCENWISDDRFKRFYGPVLLLYVENSISFTTGLSDEESRNIHLVLYDYTLEDYENQLKKNYSKSANPVQQSKFFNMTSPPSPLQFDQSKKKEVKSQKGIDLSRIGIKEKNVDVLMEKLSIICQKEKWDNSFFLNFKVKNEILKNYMFRIIKISIIKENYIFKNGYFIINTGLFTPQNKPIFVIYNSEENCIMKFILVEELEKEFNYYYEVEIPPFIFDGIQFPKLDFDKKVDIFSQWETVDLVGLYKNHKDLFPEVWKNFSRYEIKCMMIGIKNDLINKCKTSGYEYGLAVPCLSDDYSDFTFLLPISFHEDENYVNLVLEIQQKELYLVAKNLLNFDEAFLKTRICHKFKSWITEIKVLTLTFTFNNNNNIQRVLKIIKGIRTDNKKDYFNVLYYKKNENSKNFVLILRKIKKIYPDKSVLEYNITHNQMELIKQALLRSEGIFKEFQIIIHRKLLREISVKLLKRIVLE